VTVVLVLILMTLGSTRALPADVATLAWAAERLGISESTCYRLAALGQIPGAFRVGGQWRVSIPKFEREVHGNGNGAGAAL